MDTAHGLYHPDCQYMGIVFEGMERREPQGGNNFSGGDYNDDHFGAHRGLWQFN